MKMAVLCGRRDRRRPGGEQIKRRKTGGKKRAGKEDESGKRFIFSIFRSVKHEAGRENLWYAQ